MVKMLQRWNEYYKKIAENLFKLGINVTSGNHIQHYEILDYIDNENRC